MFKRIVVPVDLSERSAEAVAVAFDFASQSRGETVLLHVIETIEHVPFEELQSFYDRLEKSARKRLAELAERFASENLRVDQGVIFGNRTREIVDFVRKNDVDIVVMASHRVDPNKPGHDLVQHQLLGCHFVTLSGAAGEVNMKSIDLLMQEHKLILRALDVLDSIAVRIENSATWERADTDAVLDFLRWFGDAHHQAKEETILFPALKNAAESQNRPIEHMKLEHHRERSLVEDLEADLRLVQPQEFVVGVGRLSATLRNHIYKEDQILFETACTVLTDAEDEAVLERLNAFETDLDKKALEEKLKILRSLEWKYLRR